MSGSFFDSNVVLHLASGDAEKADRAEELVAGGGTISVQVLNEVVNVTRGKMRMSWADIRVFLANFKPLVEIRPLTSEIHEAGVELAERHNIAVYDAMIVAAALEADCDVLWSEDMQHGMIFAGRLRVANPFAA
jgi:predicted nucleic acid-binding protein